jgi:lysophospholipase L1-like esterase
VLNTGGLAKTAWETLKARMSVQPNAIYEEACFRLIYDLMILGAWDLLDTLHTYCLHTEQASLLNWLTNSRDATLSGTYTFTAGRDIAGNGVTGLINSNTNPNIAPRAGLDDTTWAQWCNHGQIDSLSGGLAGGALQRLQVSVASNPVAPNFAVALNQSSGGTLSSGAASGYGHGLIAVTRRGATDLKIFSQGVQRATSASYTSTSKPNLNLYSGGGWNNSGTLISANAAPMSAFLYGKAFTDAQHSGVDAAMVRFMTAIGNYSTPYVAWGDSLTLSTGLGVSWEDKLSALAAPWRRYVNKGVSAENAAQIYARMLADTLYLNHIQIIWAGRNNVATGTTVVDSAGILSGVASMVALAQARSNKYIVISVTNGNIAAPGTVLTVDEDLGSSKYTQIVAVNAQLATLYGTHYCDVRTALVARGQFGDANDVADFALDRPPRSLMQDDVHFNTTAQPYIAAAVNAAMVANGY